MVLFRVNAYSVSPSRREDPPLEPEGGAIAINANLRQVIDDNLKSASLNKRTSVNFQLDTKTRTNATRDSIISYAFGKPAAAQNAAKTLARRLSAAMDLRSDPCLLVIAALREDDERDVTLWTFPRDEAFRLHRGRSGPSIEVLTDIFSQSSNLRKAASFQGKQLRNHFFSGRVLDFQSSSSSREVADFWISRFLECRLGILGDAGTRMLSRMFQESFEKTSDLEEKEALFGAVMALRHSPQTRLSLQDVAEDYLDGLVRERFISSVPNPESLTSVFDFKREVFDSSLQFRIFQLESGVFVSAPLTEIGQSVQVSEGERRTLSCEGEIVDERLRRRHA
jgi:hypothetical protein